MNDASSRLYLRTSCGLAEIMSVELCHSMIESSTKADIRIKARIAGAVKKRIQGSSR